MLANVCDTEDRRMSVGNPRHHSVIVNISIRQKGEEEEVMKFRSTSSTVKHAWLLVAMSVSLGSSYATNAHATGPTSFVEVAPVNATQAFDSIPGFDMHLASDFLLYISVSSAIESGEHELAEVLDVEVVAESLEEGGVINVPPLHYDHFEPGYYAQRITTSAWDTRMKIPEVRSFLRFYVVTTGGVYAISSDEYTSATVETAVDYDIWGNEVLAPVGTGRGSPMQLPEVLEFDVPVEVEAP